MMKLNVGGLDKMVRILAGVLLVASAIMGYFVPWGWIGIIPLVTGLIGWCPAYAIFGFNSCPLSKGE